jgi:glycosyltransferase involved in cell wall biosynthesis
VGGSARHGGLFVGRLTRQKGIALLAQALSTMTAPGFTVIGEGPDAGELRDSNVVMAGALDVAGVLAFMQRASYLVIPTLSYEQFPRVLVEAYSAGLPVIAARRGALADLVKSGETGLHFEPGNASDLHAQLRWAEDHAQEMAMMGQRAREMFLSHFSPEIVYRQQIAIYEEAREAAADEAR